MTTHHSQQGNTGTKSITGNPLKRVVSNNGDDEDGEKDCNSIKRKRGVEDSDLNTNNDNDKCTTEYHINKGLKKQNDDNEKLVVIEEETTKAKMEVSAVVVEPPPSTTSSPTTSKSIFRKEEDDVVDHRIIIDSSSSPSPPPIMEEAINRKPSSPPPPSSQPTNASLSPLLLPSSSSSSTTTEKREQEACNEEEQAPPAGREPQAPPPSPSQPTSNTTIRPDILIVDAIMLGISTSSSFRAPAKIDPESLPRANKNNVLVSSQLQEKGHLIARLLNHALDDEDDEDEDEHGGRGGGDHDDTSVLSAATSKSFSSTSSSSFSIKEGPRLSEAGIIHRIEIENFMCHRKLVVELCPNINFIYGQNGSGKSAILAAIQICLGVQARKTHRATNLKELIRHSASHAKLRVTLLNSDDEDDGYRYDTYGEMITIERRIAGTSGGYNGYKIYDEYMNEKSRSKRDLDDLLDKLNIQVDNPVTIMDQESSKRFLLGKAQDKYTFFTKATDLDQLQTKYEKVIERNDDLEKQCHTMRKFTLVQAKERVMKAKETYEEFTKIEELEHKLLKYKEKQSWARYHESKELADIETNNHNILQQKSGDIQSQLAQVDEDSMMLDGVEEAKRKLDILSGEARNQAELKRGLEVKLKQACEPQKAARRQLNILQIKHNDAKDNLDKATKGLNQKRNEIIKAKESEGESKVAELTAQLQGAEANYRTLNEERNHLKKEIADSSELSEKIKPDVKQAKEKCRLAEKKLKSLELKLEELRSSTSNTMTVFGHRCPKVKQLVDEAMAKSRFTGPVLGPIGNYIHIVPGKEKYAALAELAIGNWTLDRWIVTNDHDRRVVQNIRAHVGCKNDCEIFQVSQHAKYDIPLPPYDDVETVATVLQCSDDLVFNCLVDRNRIEEKALFLSRHASESRLLKRGNDGHYYMGGGGRIKNAYFLPHGDCWSIREGVINMMSNEKRLPRHPTFNIAKSDAVFQTEQEVNDAKADLKNLIKEYSDLDLTRRDIQKKLDKSKLGAHDSKKEVDCCAKLIDEIKNKLTSIDTSSGIDTDTSDFEQEVRDACDRVKKLAEEEHQLRDHIEEQNPNICEIKANLEEARTRNDKVLDDINKAAEDLQKHISNRTSREEKLEKKRDKLKQYQDRIEKQEKVVNDLQSNVYLSLDKARRISFQRSQRDEQWRSQEEARGDDSSNSQPAIEPTTEELEKIGVKDTTKASSCFKAKIKRTEDMIQQEKVARSGIVNKEDLLISRRKFFRAKKEYQDNENKCHELERLSMILREEATKRVERWMQLRSHISDVTATKFDQMLNKKGSSGSIEFDHEGGRLDLIVQKHSHDVVSQQRDVKALSGGERSFTTIALLLALGESLETPFRVMDEFDVFLDPVARKVTIESLVEMAKSMEHRQFIFITPQDVSFVETDPMLKVFQMTPPSRKI